jgi:FkbM family methyltransferase
VLDYPSSIVSVVLPGAAGQPTVLIPKNEVFRVRDIFGGDAYGIPLVYLPSTPLTIIDIGANVGLFALYMKSIHPDSQVHCFEPVPQTLRLLQKNTAPHQRIAIYPYALSNYSGLDTINLHQANGGENSLKRTSGPGAVTATVQVMDAQTAFVRIGLNYIDILKIDTEGSEVEILESLRNYLPYIGIVMAEYHSEKDRRRIDALLGHHLLFGAKICAARLGVVKYINARLLEPERPSQVQGQGLQR